MKNINVLFKHFWKDFNNFDNYFLSVLKQRYNVNVVDENFPTKDLDAVFYSCYQNNSNLCLKYIDVKKIYITFQNDFPDFNRCDYAIGTTNLSFQRYYRFSNWHSIYSNIDLQQYRKNNLSQRNKFCSMVVSNNINCDYTRFHIFQLLNQYKKVDSGGKSFNNIGYCCDNKINFISQYKFNIAGQNSIVPGYVTQKIADAFYAGCIPIYFGDNYVQKQFNPKSFINTCKYTDKQLIDLVKEIDNNEQLYTSYLNQPLFINKQYHQNICTGFKNFLYDIIDNGNVFNHKYGYIRWLY